MREGPSIVRVTSALGDRARAEMVTLLMGGRALTATELARGAGITKQTASSHLRQLLDAQLVCMEAHGRHRYFRLADHRVAQMLEGLLDVAANTSVRTGPRDPELRRARVCYDHLAGEIAVTIFLNLQAQNALAVREGELHLSSRAAEFIERLGIDMSELQTTRRPVCRACMDWSERRHHLAGALGAALWRRLLELEWVRIEPNSRVVHITPRRERQLRGLFV